MGKQERETEGRGGERGREGGERGVKERGRGEREGEGPDQVSREIDAPEPNLYDNNTSTSQIGRQTD